MRAREDKTGAPSVRVFKAKLSPGGHEQSLDEGMAVGVAAAPPASANFRGPFASRGGAPEDGADGLESRMAARGRASLYSTASPHTMASANGQEAVSMLSCDIARLEQYLLRVEKRMCEAELSLALKAARVDVDDFGRQVHLQLAAIGDRLARVEVESSLCRDALEAGRSMQLSESRSEAPRTPSKAQERQPSEHSEQQPGQRLQSKEQCLQPKEQPQEDPQLQIQDSRQVAPQDSRQVAPTPGAASVEVAETAQPRSSQTSGRSSGRSSVRSSQLHVKIKEGTAVNRSKSFKVVVSSASRGRLMLEEDSDDSAEPHSVATEPSKASSAVVLRETLTFASRSSAKYALKESVWDASLFTGYGHMGASVNVMLAFSLVLNVLMQVALCAIVALELSRDAYDDSVVASLAAWRRAVGGEVANRVCDEDYTLSTDSLQAEMFAEARDFSSPWLTFLPMETGPVLAILVIFMWALSVTDVLRGAVDFMFAVFQLHRACASDSFSIGRAGSEFVIEGVTLFRTSWALFVGLLQLGIGMSLLISGAIWLAYTKSIPDLLANAVALSYIMQVDELIYHVLVPRRAKALVTNVTPIDMSGTLTSRLPRGMPKRAALMMIFAFGFMFAIIFGTVLPNATRMRALREVICPQ